MDTQGLVDWVNTFEFDPHIDNLEELSDGVVLYTIMNEVAPDIFRMSLIKTEASSNWVIKESNLRMLLKLVLQYYHDVLGKTTNHLEKPDLKRIASEGDIEEVEKLVQIVLGCVVQCENNQQYIQRITDLSESSQSDLMIRIQKIMEQSEEAEVDKRKSVEISNTDEINYNLTSLTNKNEELEQELARALQKLEDIRDRNEELLKDKKELERRNDELEDQLLKKEGSAINENRLMKQIQSLEAELQKSEVRKNEVEKDLKQNSTQTAELNRKIEQLSKQAQESASLKEQLDEAKQLISKLEKVESQNEKLKQKLEDMSEIKKQLAATQAERDKLIVNNKHLEETLNQVSKEGSQIKSYKEELSNLEKIKNEIETKCIFLEDDANKYKREWDELKQINNELSREVSQLKERVFELQFSENSNAESVSINDQIEKSEITELKVKIARLEKENEEIRKNAFASGDQSGLGGLLEDIKKSKSEVEANYKEEVQKNIRLTSKNKTLEKRLEEMETRHIELTSKASESTIVMEQLAIAERESKQAQIQVSELEAEISNLQRKLKATEDHLVGLQKENLSLKSEVSLMGKDKLEMIESLKTKFEEEFSQKATDTVRELKIKVQEIETLNEEKDNLSKELEKLREKLREAEEKEKETLVTINTLQSKNLALLSEKGEQNPSSDLIQKIESNAQKIVTLQEEKMQLQKSVAKAKSFIQSQNEKIKEQASRLQMLEQQSKPNQEVNQSYQTMLTDKENEVRRLQKIIEEEREAHKREQRYMTCAWYNIITQSRLKSPPKKEKQSWLGQQRVRQLNMSTKLTPQN